MTFITENGTIFELDKPSMTWKRVHKTAKSGITRSDSGTLLEWPKIELNKSAILWDTDILPGADAHFVVTSLVISIERSETDA